MQYSQFAVDTKPFCVWDPDLDRIEHEFIYGIDAEYFRFTADALSQGLDDDNEHRRAALALQASFVHASETFFALLFACVQAPDCIVGWIHCYRSADLQSLANKVTRRQPFLSKFRPSPRSWQDLASQMLTYVSLEDKEKEERIKRQFGVFWERLAHLFVDPATAREYNSIKHGLRLRSGGFRLAMGVENVPGEPAPPERMRSLGESTYGSSHLGVHPVVAGVPRHLAVGHYSQNWTVERSVIGLHLLAHSIANIQAYLKVEAHQVDPRTVEFSWPSPDDVFEQMWSPVGGPNAFNTRSIVLAEDIELFSQEEILAVYEESD